MIRRFLRRLFAAPVVGDGAFVLFVGELEDIHFAALWQGAFYGTAQGVYLRLAGAKAHVHGELRHLKPLIKQEISEIRGGLALFLSSNWQVEQGHDPHEAVG